MVQKMAWATPYRVPNTLLSDTEESVVGTQWHQDAYAQLLDMLRDINQLRGADWGVCTQIALQGLLHEDGSPYDPMPDLMVLRQPVDDGNLAAVRLEEVGVPLFIAEIASESTRRNDIGAKMRTYEAIGVPEYMVFDPSGQLLPEPVQAWRLEAGRFERWRPDSDGWWYSAQLEVALQPGHSFIRVRDRDGIELAPSGLLRQRQREEARRLAELE